MEKKINLFLKVKGGLKKDFKFSIKMTQIFPVVIIHEINDR